MSSDFHILLIDDSPSDTLIIERALREENIGHRLTTLSDGRAALDYLNGLKDSECSGRLDPDLILLDLNLPGLDGHQVLTAIKSDPILRGIPVVILTTSCRDEEIHQCYLEGANTFIRKPDEFARYQDLVAMLWLYWHETALPRPRRA